MREIAAVTFSLLLAAGGCASDTNNYVMDAAQVDAPVRGEHVPDLAGENAGRDASVIVDLSTNASADLSEMPSLDLSQADLELSDMMTFPDLTTATPDLLMCQPYNGNCGMVGQGSCCAGLECGYIFDPNQPQHNCCLPQGAPCTDVGGRDECCYAFGVSRPGICYMNINGKKTCAYQL